MNVVLLGNTYKPIVFSHFIYWIEKIANFSYLTKYK